MLGVMRLLDTTPEAFAVQAAALAGLDGSQRLMRCAELCDAARNISLAGIRQRHPEYSDREASLALFRLVNGHDVFVKAWPDSPILES